MYRLYSNFNLIKNVSGIVQTPQNMQSLEEGKLTDSEALLPT